MTADGPRTIHHTELRPAEPDSPLFVEWEAYRREVARLLAEGHEGRHVLIKGEEVVGLFATDEEAVIEGYRRYFGQPFLVHQVQERERLLRVSWLWQAPCHT